MQKLLSKLRRCVQDYDMISEGDKVGIGVSGGKDSLTLLVTMAALSKFYPQRFTVEALSVGLGYEEMDFSGIEKLCDDIGIEYVHKETKIKDVVFETMGQSEHPCSLCAKMRRGSLNDLAVERGCNKVALGHHLDDAAETFIMALFIEGRVGCFSPVTYLDRTGITVIRPMLYIHEKEISSFARRQKLPVVSNPCPADGQTKRQDTKELLKELSGRYPAVRETVIGAMQRGDIDGWGKEKRSERKANVVRLDEE